MAEGIPKILYKYATWNESSENSKYHRRLLTHREIFFASARRFNDPFDCAIAPEWSPHEKKILSRQDRKAREALVQALTYDEVGILSLSKRRDSILMWSHYSDKHRGFCVGLNVERLEAFMIRLAVDEEDTAFLEEVGYKDEYPTKNHAEESPKEFVTRHLTVKYTDWGYEDEWRYLVIGQTDRPMILNRGCFAEVIMGLNMTEGDRRELRQTLKDIGFAGKLYRAEKKQTEFGLDFRPVEYQY